MPVVENRNVGERWTVFVQLSRLRTPADYRGRKTTTKNKIKTVIGVEKGFYDRRHRVTGYYSPNRLEPLGVHCLKH